MSVTFFSKSSIKILAIDLVDYPLACCYPIWSFSCARCIVLRRFMITFIWITISVESEVFFLAVANTIIFHNFVYWLILLLIVMYRYWVVIVCTVESLLFDLIGTNWRLDDREVSVIKRKTERKKHTQKHIKYKYLKNVCLLLKS